MKFRNLSLLRRQAIYAFVLAVAVWLAVALLARTQQWREFENRAFDAMTVATAPMRSSLPITIVGIDEPSFSQLGERWPWPRRLYAQLIDRLNASGAAVIAFDVIFAEASKGDDDQLFAEAIKRAGNVVLASDHAFHETAFFKQWIRIEPLPVLREAGAVPGLATIELDGDAVVRRLPQGRDSFFRQVIETLIKARPGLVGEPQVPEDSMVRYIGPSHTYPYISFYQLLQADSSIPEDFFRDQIVLVGRDVRSSPEAGSSHADMFSTPFLSKTKLLTPGVEIHANFIENALTGQLAVAASQSTVNLTFVLAALFSLTLIWRWHLGWGALSYGAAILCLLAYSYWLFVEKNTWLPVVTPVVGLIVMHISMTLMSYVMERNRAASVKDAFSRYVSAEVVEQMVAHPERLRLGGEKRVLTLLFCDLEGFTSLSEKLLPEQVAHVINIYLTAMTRVILGKTGTVDKYIGDAIMAFWNAPLDDPDHARHAVEAAMGMIEALEGIQDRFMEEGAPGRLKIRIGLHTGPAIVGNMGSEERFDYSCLGDAVNLAARLEGVNKTYGTSILFSHATYQLLGDAFLARPIDRVRVKGKDEPVDIFTPCADTELVFLTQTALDAYWRTDWPAAREAWGRVRERAPEEKLADVFFARISEFENNPPAAGWDGSVALEKG